MARARLAKELHFEVKSETALLGQVTSLLATHGVSIIHLCAYSVGEKGVLQTIVDKPDAAAKALKSLISGIEMRDVLVVEFENKTGTLAPVAKVPGNYGIFIDFEDIKDQQTCPQIYFLKLDQAVSFSGAPKPSPIASSKINTFLFLPSNTTIFF